MQYLQNQHKHSNDSALAIILQCTYAENAWLVAVFYTLWLKRIKMDWFSTDLAENLVTPRFAWNPGAPRDKQNRP